MNAVEQIAYLINRHDLNCQESYSELVTVSEHDNFPLCIVTGKTNTNSEIYRSSLGAMQSFIGYFFVYADTEKECVEYLTSIMKLGFVTDLGHLGLPSNAPFTLPNIPELKIFKWWPVGLNIEMTAEKHGSIYMIEQAIMFEYENFSIDSDNNIVL